MTDVLQTGLDALTAWRRALDRGVDRSATLLADLGLLDDESRTLADTVRQRLASDRMVVAFVAEFSRGKSELINALFFAESGRRVMPATPGRTTMCPVELAWDAQRPPSLWLLPIATRSGGHTVSALRERPEAWQSFPLVLADAEACAQTLEEVTRSTRVTIDEARTLGFWNDEQPADNPLPDGLGRVEVPAWRHALINLPHPLLRRGLVIIDTPGLNAVGAEPELTLGLLPSAHATVFVLAADTGVTRSDLAIWREHLGGRVDDPADAADRPTPAADQVSAGNADPPAQASQAALVPAKRRVGEHFVVLNKIDTLIDPLLKPEQVQAQIERQCHDVSQLLDIDRQRVFPVSARQALAGRVMRDDATLAASRLPALEAALRSQLLPQRGRLLAQMVDTGARTLARRAQAALADRRRQIDEQLAELRALRGKSAARLALMSGRLEAEAEDFERCVPRLQALRTVLARQLTTVMASLDSDEVRSTVLRMREEANASLLRLGAGRAFATMGERLQQSIAEADSRCAEIEAMLGASQQQLNAEFGFSLASAPRPALDSAGRELARIEAAYGRYLGVTQVWRQAQPGFMDQFTRVLLSKLRTVFEAAAVEVELWVKAAGSQMDEQLRERRRSLSQRRSAFSRIQGAESDLGRSITDLEERLAQLQRAEDRVGKQIEALRAQAADLPVVESSTAHGRPADLAAARLHLVSAAHAAA